MCHASVPLAVPSLLHSYCDDSFWPPGPCDDGRTVGGSIVIVSGVTAARGDMVTAFTFGIRHSYRSVLNVIE
jgi:hypothetical protein